MDDMINRHDSIAEENIEPNGRPATNARMIRKTVPTKTVRNV